jgi:dipeptidyl-peptidase 4
MKKYISMVCCLIILSRAGAQELSRQDYARAVSFLAQNLVNKKIFNLNPQFNWFPDSTGFSFVVQSKEGKFFNKFLFKKMDTERLFDHVRLAKILSDSLKTEIKSNDLPINSARYIDRSVLELNIKSKDYRLDLNTYSFTPKKLEEKNPMEEKSPDGKWIAYSEGYNLYIKSTETGHVKQLSFAGKKNYEYASYYNWGEIIEGENGVRPPHFTVYWSPDSRWIQTYICDLSKGQKMYLLDWSVDTLYRARLLSYYRGSPGDTDMVYMIPVFFNVQSGEEFRKDELRNVNAASFEWAKDSGIIYAQNDVRGYQEVNGYRYDLNKQARENIYTETSATNIDNFNARYVKEWNKFIISSERDGWKQLYLLDIKDKIVSPVTSGAYYVNDILFINIKSGTILFTASGKEPGRNPYYQHLYKININGKGLILLTPENANHDISVSPDGKYVTDNISAFDLPTRSVLRESNTGKIVKELTKVDIDELMSMKYRFPKAFTATAHDGKTTIYGAIWMPTNFDSSRKYPVIDQSYTGPHTHMFPQSFISSINRPNQAFAELGFVVVTIDGMGTAGRSKAFHNVSYKNMGKNLTDHVLAIRELGKKYSWVDTSRVGIFGHSAGGYDAGHAVLEFPDFYKVAVASSGDHDFRMEKDWWPEMYMGWPVDSTYNQVSNITMAGNLKGKLLIVHGGIDENVNPSATFKLAEALVKADKEFDMLIFPSQHHGYTGKFNDYFIKKRFNYFVENLLGAKPIWDFELK